ncbi:hypothetical protein A2291_04505 [candidate division WOR-1 bacterium RIFOXYB2_FULL_42_35]|uniref:GH16 domain-containing protein n=1 Tax=candidate division WOR-1 bacterium RIFOXYC2_FULL_41_25 TaxID=1802586 RepID=A0A1F4TRB7_UNCSA|nr:MAG: hypothetical protein A2247_07620 [candidate division WOR-1 bacterium RIFOXYA2_FULL_41_14]OGC25825.1 MAG: hypothetical protein A2291_04505 [candidate division WOR-1 bacterium RIFOXYB2_FULL_42_35]OGC35265.1 MAG: hypothetical protein A2462_08495 [candidate division WOR-1 bacterium RIFOXYC2_FULL_41_25]
MGDLSISNTIWSLGCACQEAFDSVFGSTVEKADKLAMKAANTFTDGVDSIAAYTFVKEPQHVTAAERALVPVVAVGYGVIALFPASCSDPESPPANDAGPRLDGPPHDFINPDGITCNYLGVKLDDSNVIVTTSDKTSSELSGRVLRFYAKDATNPGVSISSINSNDWQLNYQSQLSFEISSKIKLVSGLKAQPKVQIYFKGNNSNTPNLELSTIPGINAWVKQTLIIPLSLLPKTVGRIRFFVETKGADVDVLIKNVSFNCGNVADGGLGDQGVQPDLVRLPDSGVYVEQGSYDAVIKEGPVVDQGYSDGLVVIDQSGVSPDGVIPDYFITDILKPDTGAAPSGQLITGTPTYVHNMNAHDSANWQMSTWANGSPFDVMWKSSQITFANGFMTITLVKSPSGSQYSYDSGEYRTIQQIYTDGYFEARMKGAQGSGLISAFFIWGNSKDEVDIVEIPGKDCKGFQLNYYLKGVGGHETMVYPGGNFDACKDFHNYGVHKTTNFIKYYLDGKLVLTVINSTSTPLPSQPGHMMFNLWVPDKTLYGWAGQPTFTPPAKALVDWLKHLKP